MGGWGLPTPIHSPMVIPCLHHLDITSTEEEERYEAMSYRQHIFSRHASKIMMMLMPI